MTTLRLTAIAARISAATGRAISVQRVREIAAGDYAESHPVETLVRK